MTMDIAYALTTAASLALWGAAGYLINHFLIDRPARRNRR